MKIIFHFLSVWLENSICFHVRGDVNSVLLIGSFWSRGQWQGEGFRAGWMHVLHPAGRDLSFVFQVVWRAFLDLHG